MVLFVNCQLILPRLSAGKICWHFLTRHWYDWAGIEEKGATFNKNIEYLLTTFFSCHHNKLKVIQTMTEKLQEEVNTLNNKDTSLDVLPNINKYVNT